MPPRRAAAISRAWASRRLLLASQSSSTAQSGDEAARSRGAPPMASDSFEEQVGQPHGTRLSVAEERAKQPAAALCRRRRLPGDRVRFGDERARRAGAERVAAEAEAPEGLAGDRERSDGLAAVGAAQRVVVKGERRQRAVKGEAAGEGARALGADAVRAEGELGERLVAQQPGAQRRRALVAERILGELRRS